MKQAIIWLSVVLAIFAAMIWARPSGNAVASESLEKASVLVALQNVYDFGTIRMKDGNVEHVFEVKNPGKEDIKLPSLRTSCMCTSAYFETPGGERGPFGMLGMGYVPPLNEIIKAGETKGIRVVYNPNAHGPAGVGSIDRFVYLTDESNRVLKLEIKALVTP